MAVVAANAALNFDQLFLGALGQRVITNYTSTFAQAEGEGVTDRYYGNFIFNGAGELVGGTLTQYIQLFQNQMVLQIYNVSIPVVDLAVGILNDVSLANFPIFNGADLITGSAFADLIRSQGGDDDMALKLSRSSFICASGTLGKSTSQRISSGVWVSMRVCRPSVYCSKTARSIASIRLRERTSICSSTSVVSPRKRSSAPSM